MDPVAYSPGIGVVGAGGISQMHLAAYRAAGYRVLAICDLDLARAEHRREEFFPDAETTIDFRELLARGDIEVVDIATHVEGRPALVSASLQAGKHVLSQKPFVRDLGVGQKLAEEADDLARRLAVNQNGRWAPHFAYLLAAVHNGVIGTVTSADFAVYWPHDAGVRDDPNFSTMADLVLYDFGIHWFDVIAQVFASQGSAIRVFASLGDRPRQLISVPTQAQVVIDFEDAQATLLLRGSAPRLEEGSYRVEGTDGVLSHHGLSLGGTDVRVVTDREDVLVPLEGNWWVNGMHGTMAELLRAVEENRQPSNQARASLPGLALCFAAIESARTGQVVDPRTIKRAPDVL
jgi:predicted dehydrogenase